LRWPGGHGIDARTTAVRGPSGAQRSGSSDCSAKIPTVGAPTAAATCIGPESIATTARARSASAPNAPIVVAPAIEIAPRPARSAIASAIAHRRASRSPAAAAVARATSGASATKPSTGQRAAAPRGRASDATS
jgi:hypothetical protein